MARKSLYTSDILTPSARTESGVGVIRRTLSHYRIVEPLGAGGMGEVYRAHDEKLGRDVAVKVLPADSLSDEAARRRFQKEAEALVPLTPTAATSPTPSS